MLILSRRPGEALFLTDGARQLKVAVLGLKGNQVKLGVEAPADVRVEREELAWRGGVQPAQCLPHGTRKTLGLSARACVAADVSDEEVAAFLLAGE